MKITSMQELFTNVLCDSLALMYMTLRDSYCSSEI